MKPKISIIIRTKNEERWILKCLEQIKKQTLKIFEIILVDNNSTDKTVEKAYLAGVKKIFSIRCFKFFSLASNESWINSTRKQIPINRYSSTHVQLS